MSVVSVTHKWSGLAGLALAAELTALSHSWHRAALLRPGWASAVQLSALWFPLQQSALARVAGRACPADRLPASEI